MASNMPRQPITMATKLVWTASAQTESLFTPPTQMRQNCLVCDKKVLSCPCRRCKQAMRTCTKLTYYTIEIKSNALNNNVSTVDCQLTYCLRHPQPQHDTLPVLVSRAGYTVQLHVSRNGGRNHQNNIQGPFETERSSDSKFPNYRPRLPVM